MSPVASQHVDPPRLLVLAGLTCVVHVVVFWYVQYGVPGFGVVPDPIAP